MNFRFLRSKSFGIDLGNSNTLVSDEHNILLEEPSYIAFDKTHGTVRAVGDEAFSMYEKSHQHLKTVKPLKGGVIADYQSASTMINEMIKKSKIKKSALERFDTILCGVPFGTTDVERRALTDALDQFHASRTSLIYEPLAGALGMDLDICEPDGKMLVDLGGGITEIVIISLSGVASFQALKTSGDSMDADVQRYFRNHFNMSIGLKTAEQIKIALGSVLENIPDAPAPLTVRGKDMLTGLPAVKILNHKDVVPILEKSISAIEGAIIQTLEKCPPELASDIYHNGIHVTGGNAQLRGLQRRLEMKLKLPIHIDGDPLRSVSKGIAKVLRNPQKYQSLLMR
jgi:rod shape-determining protein MreB and related proteins